MDERQDQIQQRMETVRIAQQESLERREQLLKDLEIANQMTQREIEDKHLAKLERKRDIDSQVREQNRRAKKFSSNLIKKKKLHSLLLFILIKLTYQDMTI